MSRATFTAKTMFDALLWVQDHEHYQGYWTGIEGKQVFVLEGHTHRLRIPESVHVPGLFAGSDYEKTRRMYEPSPAGSALLGDESKGGAA